MRFGIVSAITAWATACGLAAAHPLRAQDDLRPRAGEIEPCRQLRDTVLEWYTENKIVPRNLSTIEALIIPAVPPAPVAPSLAFSCLKSIPLDRETALQQTEFLVPLFAWQSTVDYLKDPPRGYLSEGVDLLGGLDDITAKLKAETPAYTNEFDFVTDLRGLVRRARDAHFGFVNILLDLFTPRPGVEFASISKDGLALPEIFVHDDVKHDKDGYVPSPVVTVDGIPVLEYLQKMAIMDGSTHDPDARFNGLFPSVSKNANYQRVDTGADAHILGLNDTTTVTLMNNSILTFNNTAFVRANLTNITSAADLYAEFGLAGGTAPLPIDAGLDRAYDMGYKSNFTNGFPPPVVMTAGGDCAGFLPSDPSLKDTAVLAINSFVPAIDLRNLANSTLLFDESNKVILDFLRQAKASRRSKLILDLQGNSGGQILSLAILYFNLFPGKVFPALSQARVHPQLDWLLKESEKIKKNATDLTLPWQFRLFETPSSTPWPSYREWYGPVEGHEGLGNYTRPALLKNSTLFPIPVDVTPPSSEPPFRPEDIIIVTDGECASACAVLVDALVHTHGVRTVAFGGRPIQKPMQAIGKVKGGPIGHFTGFPAINRTTAPSGVRVVPDHPPPMRIRFSPVRGSDWKDGFAFNVANMIPLNASDDAIPYQFLYEAANCKLFFTWEMARDVTAIWKAAASAAWGQGKCVKGSTTTSDGTLGGMVPYDEGVDDEYRLGAGPGSLE